MNNKFMSNVFSQYFGKFASTEFSEKVQKIINNGYVKLMKLDMSEFAHPESYKTLNELFTRKLRTPRKFSIASSDFISPCDALITECGTINDHRALQIKGFDYKVNDLLTENISDENKAKLEGGDFINLYLSPSDYHRYHVPLNMRVTKAIHVPGKLHPVNIPTLKKQVNLFIENERVILECYSQAGKLFYLVLVGALNVGKMVVSFDDRIQTNSDTREIKVYEYSDINLHKGDDLGYFMMGSTIVVLAEKDMLEYNLNVNQKVKFSDTIATVK